MYVKKRDQILFCSNVNNGNCQSRNWSYKRFEQAMLSFVSEIDLEAVINGGTNSKISELTTQIDKLDGEKADILK